MQGGKDLAAPVFRLGNSSQTIASMAPLDTVDSLTNSAYNTLASMEVVQENHCTLNKSHTEEEGRSKFSHGISGKEMDEEKGVEDNLPAFVTKVYEMVNDTATDNIISWDKKGTEFDIF